MDKKKLIIGIGEVLWDCFPSGDRLGGAPLNFVAHCQQLGRPHGIQSAMVSRVGTDSLGTKALEIIEQFGIDCRNIQRDPQHKTGIVKVQLNAGQPTYEIMSDVAWDYLQWNSELEQLQQQADVVCFGSLGQRSAASRDVIQQFVRGSRASIRLFDINLRPPFVDRRVIMSALSLANVLKLNEEELLWLADELGVPKRDDIEVTAQAVRHELALDTLLLTRSALGCFLVTRDNVYSAEVPKLEFAPDADAVGAGDAATAAFVIGLLLGLSPAEIVAKANCVGAYVASQPGAVPTLPESLL